MGKISDGPSPSQEHEKKEDQRVYAVLELKTEFEHVFYPLPLEKVVYDVREGGNEQYLLEECKAARSEVVQLREQLGELERARVIEPAPVVQQGPCE